MAGNPEIVVKYRSDTAGLDKGLKQMNKSASGVGRGLKIAGAAAAAGIGLIGVAAAKTVKDASNLNESMNAVNVVFGKAAKTVLDFGETAAAQAGSEHACFQRGRDADRRLAAKRRLLGPRGSQGLDRPHDPSRRYGFGLQHDRARGADGDPGRPARRGRPARKIRGRLERRRRQGRGHGDGPRRDREGSHGARQGAGPSQPAHEADRSARGRLRRDERRLRQRAARSSAPNSRTSPRRSAACCCPCSRRPRRASRNS